MHIHHPVGGDAEFFEHLIRADAFVLHRVEHFHAVTDQLHQVFVGRNDRHRAPRITRTAGQGGDDVIRLEPLRLDTGDVEGAGGIAGQRELRAQIFGQFRAIGLVGGVNVIAEGF